MLLRSKCNQCRPIVLWCHPPNVYRSITAICNTLGHPTKKKLGRTLVGALIFFRTIRKSYHTSITMGHHIPRERKEVALQMSVLGLQDRTIRRYTGVSERSMRYLRKTFRETGEVVRVPLCTGRPRILDSLDTTVNSYPFLYFFYL